jgi:hypothetical protein
MEPPLALGITFDGPAGYRILISGGIPENWSDRMDGMSIRHETPDNGVMVTILEGELADQAALIGVINTLYNLHLPIILVASIVIGQITEFASSETNSG